jgi:hypothetical protein
MIYPVIRRRPVAAGQFRLAIAAVRSKASNAMTTYVWTGGQPGFSGSITLDSASSPPGGGTVSDIVSISLGFPAPAGNFSYPPGEQIINAVFDLNGPFSWNSQEITAMTIRWAPSGAVFQNLELGPNLLSDYNANGWSDTHTPNPMEDDTGSWQAADPVPGPGTP